ncbi:MAG: FAD-dependent oxidoreductase [Gammaproteobacteria bacterium]|nr:FAD-dependent oxidoreductase [Gammaproteobacteria bacterium]
MSSSIPEGPARLTAVEPAATPVLIVGAGPVGLCLALDLARRGIASTVLERRPAGELPSVKCNHVSARTMETFRELGFASRVRAAGLPDEYPNDVVVRTTATGHELMRIHIPCRRDRFTDTSGPDGAWPTPEPPHRVNQIYLEPILFDEARRSGLITLRNRVEFVSHEQDEQGVTVLARDLDAGTELRWRARFMVGCEGGRSLVRNAIGARLVGDEVVQRVQSTWFRAPDLIHRITKPDAWMSYLYTTERAGNLVAIDGRETWLLHNYLLPHEADSQVVDRDRCLRRLLGVGPEFSYTLLSKEDWIGRRMVANRFRDRRVFICGDAAHLWVPYAGYGMNAGIADAMNLSWQLAAHLLGWAPEALLAAHERERQPITEQVSRFAMRHAMGAIRERTGVPPALEDATAEGEAARRAVGEAAYALHVQQFACAGLNFGYYYDDSPVIARDEEAAPGYTMHEYTPSTVPGCRTPHLWLRDGRSLLDATGPWFTLLRFDPGVEVFALERAARNAGMPLQVLDVDSDAIPSAYRHRLLLDRPDHHVAWRGDVLPADPVALVDLVRGARAA